MANQAVNTSSSGHFYIAGIFGVHEAGQTFYQCGAIREQGILNLEAFLWAVRTFRTRSSNILKDINVGAMAFDTCQSVDRVVQQVLNLESCSVAYASPVVQPNRVLAFVGPDSSSEAKTLAPLMAQIRKPIVSHAATSPDLSDRKLKYFLRTAPSDSEQVNAIMEVFDNQGWFYAQLVYSDNAYGQAGRDALQEEMKKAGKCVVTMTAVTENPSDAELENLVETLVENSKTRAVILFTDGNTAKKVLNAVKTSDARGLFSWIGK